MTELNNFIFDNFNTLITISVVWCVFGIIFLLWRRKLRALVLPGVNDNDVVFAERFASGASHKSWMTRMGGAANCLTVIVTESHLVTTTFFPFTAFAGFYDLEHLIPILDITGLSSDSKITEVEFKRTDGTDGKLTLRLRNSPDFIQTIKCSIHAESKLVVK